jgi:hypothetical protein
MLDYLRSMLGGADSNTLFLHRLGDVDVRTRPK